MAGSVSSAVGTLGMGFVARGSRRRRRWRSRRGWRGVVGRDALKSAGRKKRKGM